jgi:hypothetical protein
MIFRQIKGLDACDLRNRLENLKADSALEENSLIIHPSSANPSIYGYKPLTHLGLSAAAFSGR